MGQCERSNIHAFKHVIVVAFPPLKHPKLMECLQPQDIPANINTQCVGTCISIDYTQMRDQVLYTSAYNEEHDLLHGGKFFPPSPPSLFCRAWYFCDFTGTNFFRVQVIEFFRFETTCGSHLNMDSRAFNFFFIFFSVGVGFKGRGTMVQLCIQNLLSVCFYFFERWQERNNHFSSMSRSSRR